MLFKVIYGIIRSKTCQPSRGNSFIYFKYLRKIPGKSAKKVLENPGFLKS